MATRTDVGRIRPALEGATDRLMTADEVAEIVGLRVDYVWALCRSNQIPHIRFGRVKRFRQSSILAWLEEREQGDTG